MSFIETFQGNFGSVSVVKFPALGVSGTIISIRYYCGEAYGLADYERHIYSFSTKKYSCSKIEGVNITYAQDNDHNHNILELFTQIGLSDEDTGALIDTLPQDENLGLG